MLFRSETRKGNRGEVVNEESLRVILDANKIELLNEMRKLQESLNLLQLKISNVDATLTKVLETQKAQDVEIKSLKEQVWGLSENYANIMNEVEERERRRPNLIVAGLQEKEVGSVEERKEWDSIKVDELFEELCNFEDSVVSSVYRIGKINSSRPRLLKIICRDVNSKRSLLSKSKYLRDSIDFKNVYLNPDLTPIQQKENKRLREELKARRDRGEDVFIRHGRIVEKGFRQNFH